MKKKFNLKVKIRMNSKVTGFFPSGFFDHQIKRVSQIPAVLESFQDEKEKQLASLKKKYPERTIFSAECGQPREWEEELFDAQIIPNATRMLFAVDEKFMAMELAAFLVDLKHETIKIHRQSK